MQDLLNGIDELAELAENERSQPTLSAGDMVVFASEEGEELVGQIEAIENEVANVRIMATSGESMEPTDDVVALSLDKLSLMNSADDDEADSEEALEEKPEEDGDKEAEEQDEEPEEEEEDDEEEKSIVKDSFVMWQSGIGAALGRVVQAGCAHIIPETGEEYEAKENLALIEVYHGNQSYEATGVHVAHRFADLKAIDAPEIKPSRIVVKMKKYDNEEGENVGIIEGLASAYGEVDLGGDTVSKGAYTQTISHNNGQFQLMFDHGWGVRDVAGVSYVEDSDEGLRMKGEMPIHIASVREAYEKIKFMGEKNQPIGLSIGYIPVKTEPGRNGTRILKEIALQEISITPYPMDTFARIRDAKSRKISYHLKRSGWQKISTKKTDAPQGNRVHEVDWDSLREDVIKLKQTVKEITNA